MVTDRKQRVGNRLVVVGLLVAVAGPAGCVQDDFGRMSGDAPTLGSTSEGPLLPVTGIDVYDSSGAAPDDSTDGADGSTAADPTGDDASTSGPGDASGSTGEMVDGSTGEMALGIDQLVPGDLVVTEVMWNPSCSQDLCEWFEILNATDETVNLLDLYVQDTDQNAGNQGRITSDVLVGPGDVVVVTRSLNFWPYDFEAGAVYGPNPGLNNGSPDRVVLRNETEVLDQTGIFPLEGTEGIAWSLSGDALDADSNDLSAFWCSATVELPTTSTTEFGTPGQINDPC